MKKKLIMLIIISGIVVMGAQEMDFNIFNYKDSRLKRIVRYREGNFKKLTIDQEAIYTYNDDGYLIGRELRMYYRRKKYYILYKSELEYSGDKKVITEKFYKGVDPYHGWSNEIEYWKYYYEDGLMVKFERIRSDLSKQREINFQYNERKDIVFITNYSGYGYLPGDGFAVGGDNKFRYDYEGNKKIRYLYDEKRDKYGTRNEFLLNETHLLIKINFYNPYSGEWVAEVNLKYDNNNNVIEMIEKSSGYRGYKYFYDLFKFFYDDKNRLVKKIEYYSINSLDDVDKAKIDYVEEYYYEDGKYQYYPYLLPVKINYYATPQYPRLVDKDIF